MNVKMLETIGHAYTHVGQTIHAYASTNLMAAPQANCDVVSPFKSLIDKLVGAALGAFAAIFLIVLIVQVAITLFGSEKTRAGHAKAAVLALIGLILFGGGSLEFFGLINVFGTSSCI